MGWVLPCTQAALIPTTTHTHQAREVPDKASIQDQEIKTDSVLYMVYRSEGGECLRMCPAVGVWSIRGGGVPFPVEWRDLPHSDSHPSRPTTWAAHVHHTPGDGWEEVDVTGSGDLK